MPWTEGLFKYANKTEKKSQNSCYPIWAITCADIGKKNGAFELQIFNQCYLIVAHTIYIKFAHRDNLCSEMQTRKQKQEFENWNSFRWSRNSDKNIAHYHISLEPVKIVQPSHTISFVGIHLALGVDLNRKLVPFQIFGIVLTHKSRDSFMRQAPILSIYTPQTLYTIDHNNIYKNHKKPIGVALAHVIWCFCYLNS